MPNTLQNNLSFIAKAAPREEPQPEAGAILRGAGALSNKPEESRLITSQLDSLFFIEVFTFTKEVKSVNLTNVLKRLLEIFQIVFSSTKKYFQLFFLESQS